MAVFNFTTGPATLPDIGELSYNGCVFSPLFVTQVDGNFIKDDAGRTVKEIEYTITVDGYVTLPEGRQNVQDTLGTLERLLSAPAGALTYTGRGIKIVVNTAGGDRDNAWGPLPEILEITPLGSGGSAHIKWTVKTRIPPRLQSRRAKPLLQFSYETVVSYDDAGYSRVSMTGIVEIPLTRTAQTDRTINRTADDFRSEFPGELLRTIDLTRFRVVRRDFTTSKDKRSLTFAVEIEELPWMAMPPDVTIARGQFSFRPAKAGLGLCNWLCSLSVTYTIPKPNPRRIAWLAFLALLRLRMKEGNLRGLIPPPDGNQNPGIVAQIGNVAGNGAVIPIAGPAINNWIQFFQQQQQGAQGATRKTWLIDFSGNEGLYLDSKTVTFSATWRLITVFSEILLASGLWKKVPQQNENAWATSVRRISGASSWLRNGLDPNADIIVDFGF